MTAQAQHYFYSHLGSERPTQSALPGILQTHPAKKSIRLRRNISLDYLHTSVDPPVDPLPIQQSTRLPRLCEVLNQHRTALLMKKKNRHMKCRRRSNELQTSLQQVQEQNSALQGDAELQKMIQKNSADTVKVMSTFYMTAFREIEDEFGFHLGKLGTIRKVLSEDQMCIFREQIRRLELLSEKIGHELPSLSVMRHFYGLLEGLRISLEDEKFQSLRKTQQLLIGSSQQHVPQRNEQQLSKEDSKRVMEAVEQIGKEIKLLTTPQNDINAALPSQALNARKGKQNWDSPQQAKSSSRLFKSEAKQLEANTMLPLAKTVSHNEPENQPVTPFQQATARKMLQTAVEEESFGIENRPKCRGKKREAQDASYNGHCFDYLNAEGVKMHAGKKPFKYNVKRSSLHSAENLSSQPSASVGPTMAQTVESSFQLSKRVVACDMVDNQTEFNDRPDSIQGAAKNGHLIQDSATPTLDFDASPYPLVMRVRCSPKKPQFAIRLPKSMSSDRLAEKDSPPIRRSPRKSTSPLKSAQPPIQNALLCSYLAHIPKRIKRMSENLEKIEWKETLRGKYSLPGYSLRGTGSCGRIQISGHSSLVATIKPSPTKQKTKKAYQSNIFKMR